MNTQAEENKKWLHEVQSNIGSITLLGAPKVKTKLKHPYQFEASIAQVEAFVNGVKKLDPHKALQSIDVWKKACLRGVRLDVYMTGCSPEWLKNPRPNEIFSYTGILEEDWNLLVEKMRKLVTKLTKGEGSLYAEAWNADDRFNLRFETYIQYKELK